MKAVAAFRSARQTYYADTCQQLTDAAGRGEVRLEARVHGAYPGLPLAETTLPELHTVGYWDAEHAQSWGLDWHRNEGIELTYLARGKVDFAVDDQEFHLKRGHLTITRPWQAHRVGNPTIDACRLHWLILDVGVRRPNQTWQWPAWLASSASDIACLTTMLSHNEYPVWEADDDVAFYFDKLGEVVTSGSPHDEGSRESHLRLHTGGLLVAVTELLRRRQPMLDSSLSLSQRTVELFLTTVLPHHLDQEWDIDRMAAQCGLRRSRFAHYCKEITNMSPNEYVTLCRVQLAAHLLTTERAWSVMDVALRCGFNSSQYFATVFRQHARCSPRTYREQVKVAIRPEGETRADG